MPQRFKIWWWVLGVQQLQLGVMGADGADSGQAGQGNPSEMTEFELQQVIQQMSFEWNTGLPQYVRSSSFASLYLLSLVSM